MIYLKSKVNYCTQFKEKHYFKSMCFVSGNQLSMYIRHKTSKRFFSILIAHFIKKRTVSRRGYGFEK